MLSLIPAPTPESESALVLHSPKAQTQHSLSLSLLKLPRCTNNENFLDHLHKFVCLYSFYCLFAFINIYSGLWDNGNEMVGFFVWRVFSGFESFVFKSLFYHSLWVWWWLNHFVSWENVVFHEGDCFGCMFLILVGWLSWLDVFYFYKTLTFWSCFQLSLCVYIYILFWEERDIKWE